MSEGVPQFIEFPGDGRPWRIDWIGQILPVPYRKTPMAQVEISAPGAPGHSTRERRIVEMSVSELPFLHVGKTFSYGKRDDLDVTGSELVTAICDIQVPNMSLHRANDKARGMFIIPPAKYSISPYFKDTRFVLIDRQGRDDIGDLIIPCTEITAANVLRIHHHVDGFQIEMRVSR